MSENIEIIEFNPDNNEHITLIGNLHTEILPGSNVPGLGPLFMRYFYYSVLPKRDLINCFLAKYNGEYAGLIVGTKYPSTLIKRGMAGNKFKLALIIATSILIKPSRLKSVLNQLSYKVDPAQKEYEESGTAIEMLTIGVKAKYRDVRFSDSKKIAHKLAEHALAFYKKQGYTKMIGQIIKSNMAPIKFWTGYGGTFTGSGVRDTGCLVIIDITKLKLY